MKFIKLSFNHKLLFLNIYAKFNKGNRAIKIRQLLIRNRRLTRQQIFFERKLKTPQIKPSGSMFMTAKAKESRKFLILKSRFSSIMAVDSLSRNTRPI
jgi:hypothetical protein